MFSRGEKEEVWGWGSWRLALRRTPTNVEDQQYRERERGVFGGLERGGRGTDVE